MVKKDCSGDAKKPCKCEAAFNCKGSEAEKKLDAIEKEGEDTEVVKIKDKEDCDGSKCPGTYLLFCSPKCHRNECNLTDLTTKCKSKSGICTPTFICPGGSKEASKSEGCHCVISTACFKKGQDSSSTDKKKSDITDLDDKMEVLRTIGKGRIKNRLQGVISTLRENENMRAKLAGKCWT